MYVFEDGEYLIVSKGSNLDPYAGDIKVSVTGSMGTARVYFKHYLDVDNGYPYLDKPIESGVTYRFSGREDVDIFLVVENSDVYTSLTLNVTRSVIKTELEPTFEDEDPDVFPTKVIQVYQGNQVLVSYLYPFEFKELPMVVTAPTGSSLELDRLVERGYADDTMEVAQPTVSFLDLASITKRSTSVEDLIVSAPNVGYLSLDNIVKRPSGTLDQLSVNAPTVSFMEFEFITVRTTAVDNLAVNAPTVTFMELV